MQLFISYARADKAVVETLIADVHSLGHHAFYDRDLAGGQRWWDELLDQIHSCDAFLPVLSSGYRESEACHAEAVWAEGLAVPFLPIAFDDQIPGFFDPVIAEANWVSYDPQSRSALADLARAIATIVPTSRPDVLPERPQIPLTYLNAIDRALHDTTEITRSQQLTMVFDLRSKLGTRDEQGARELLAALRARPEITFEAATMIDDLSGRASPTSRPAETPAVPQADRQVDQPSEPPAKPPTSPPPSRPVPSSGPPPSAADPTPDVRSVSPPPPPVKALAASTTEGSSPGTGLLPWVALGLTVVGIVLVGVAAFVAPWTTTDVAGVDIDYQLLGGASNPIPDVIGLLAVLALVVSVATAVAARVMRLDRRWRIAAACYDILVAALGLLGTALLTDHDFDEARWGSPVLAVGLAMLAVATLMPSGRRSAKPA